jgi:hypothetical protein
MINSRYDKLRFRFEYGGESIEELCADIGIPVVDLSNYATVNNWTVQGCPEIHDTKGVNDYYSLARHKLTVATTRQAMVRFSNLATMEDNIITLLSKTITEHLVRLDQSEQDPDSTFIMDGLELTRLTKILMELKASNKIYEESINVPALADKDIKGLLEAANSNMSVEKVYELMKEYGIVKPENEITDNITGAEASRRYTDMLKDIE